MEFRQSRPPVWKICSCPRLRDGARPAVADDVMRRFGAGELSEVLGEGTLKIDREQRILGLRAAAQKIPRRGEPARSLYFDAYARGVNAFIEERAMRYRLSFMF